MQLVPPRPEININDYRLSELITLSDIAKKEGVHKSNINYWINSNDFPSSVIRRWGLVFFLKADVEKWLLETGRKAS